jgi:hypothetical protein
MDPALLLRLAAWLERPDVRAVDPERIDALGAALAGADPPVSVGRGGTWTAYDPGPGRRRLVQLDRRGTLVAACRWAPDGALAWAKCLTANGAWIGVEPAAASRPAWGMCDRLWRLGPDEAWAPREELTVFQAIDYGHPDFIPPLHDPQRLPPGAGTAVLNLIAGLMTDRGVARVRYRGPYPTEHLFTTLLESFRYDASLDDPLGRFMDGGALDWLPAPHESHHVAAGVSIRLRHEIDAVVLDGDTFYRADWQGVIRRESRVVRRAGERVICSLWALGRPIEDRLVLDRAGEVLERPAPAADARPPAPLPPAWGPALGELIARDSAGPLAAPLREVVPALPLEWGSVPGDLLGVRGARVRLSRRLREVGVAWIREAAPGPERGQRAIVFVLEVARLLAPMARQRAQARLAALSPDEQERALAADAAPSGELPESVGRLVALVASGGA